MVKFDQEGNRVESEYEIVNLQANQNGSMEWAPVAFWIQGVVDCNGNKFEWPSGAEFPPLDVTLRRRLRVVTALSKPFAYLSGVEDAEEGGQVVSISCSLYFFGAMSVVGFAPSLF